MNIAIWEWITDNLKIEIIFFMVTSGHKFAIYNTNVNIQKHIPFVAACTQFQYQYVITNIFCNRTKTIQIQCAYMI